MSTSQKPCNSCVAWEVHDVFVDNATSHQSSTSATTEFEKTHTSRLHEETRFLSLTTAEQNEQTNTKNLACDDAWHNRSGSSRGTQNQELTIKLFSPHRLCTKRPYPPLCLTPTATQESQPGRKPALSTQQRVQRPPEAGHGDERAQPVAHHRKRAENSGKPESL